MTLPPMARLGGLVASHPVVFFGTEHDPETSAAGRLLYEQSVCAEEQILDNGLGMFIRAFFTFP